MSPSRNLRAEPVPSPRTDNSFSLSPAVKSARDPFRAGASPNRIPEAKVTPIVNASTRQFRPTTYGNPSAKPLLKEADEPAIRLERAAQGLNVKRA